MRRVLAILLAASAVLVTVEARSKHRHSSSNAPGNFDYYLLSLSWAPDYCAMPNANRNSRECGSGNHVGFVVHGLWPEFYDGRYPKECAPAQPVAQDIVNRMLTYYPDPGLIQHEWREHGTCSGLSAAEYFAQVRKAFDSVKIPDEYRNLNREIQVRPADVEAKFRAANPAFPGDAFRVGCAGGSQLSEVRICFTKDIKPAACPASERECNAGMLTMLPEK